MLFLAMDFEKSGKCEICGKKNILVRSYKLLYGSTISSFSIGNFIDDPPLLNKEFYICIKCRKKKITFSKNS